MRFLSVRPCHAPAGFPEVWLYFFIFALHLTGTANSKVEFDVRDSDLIEHTGVDRETIKKIKQGDTSVAYTLYENVSQHMYDLYMMTDSKDYYVRWTFRRY